ncbi:MAG TPA: cytochrome C oxidase subunit IV family protein [Candidatus Limnocylindrales bacterium]|nr:cytochrome C oxidase subunit IV family protein [Candidatus Limnocylindrales bacterium]
MDAHSTSAQTGPAAHAGADDHFSHHIRRYLFVFYALIFGTVITVLASYIPFGNREINIAVALVIAIAKASLVACYFMHLISERKMIYGIMAFTAFFFIGLMFLTLGTYADFPRNTVTH